MYLKPNVVFEPLVHRWYAWSHLIYPATAAMNMVGRHLPIIDSFLAAPEIHIKAVNDPRMRGGPFIDLPENETGRVGLLKQETLKDYGRMIELANAIRGLDRMLEKEATGFSLEEIYQKIPSILKGFVELYYDRNNRPGFRFFEQLLYQSSYYDTGAQSLALWITNNDHRPFCLTTPRLAQPDVLDLSIPFDSPAIDELAKMKREQGSIDAIAAKLGVPPDKRNLFDTFFTSVKPPVYEKYDGDHIRMRYFGHACILIETRDVSILVDPLVSYYGYDSGVSHFSDVDLPDMIDYVLITHNHQDHILLETLLPLRHKIKNIIVPDTTSGKLEDPSVALMFETIGFHQVNAIREMQTLHFADASIMSIPFTGEHSDLNILTKSCYLVSIGGFKLMFLADSRILEPALYQRIHEQIGDVDVVFLGMECDGAPLSWLYGPLLTKPVNREQDNSRRLSGSDCARGMSIVDIFNPREVYVYAMGQEPWVEFISSIKYTDQSNPIIQSNELVRICRQRGITAERLYGEKEILYDRVIA